MARKVILYTAASLDGKIARLNGAVDWLDALPNPSGTDHRYSDLTKRIDTTLMGFKTFEVVLGLKEGFPYGAFENFVFTRQDRPESPFVKFVNSDPAQFVRDLKVKEGKDIWLIGGGEMNALLLKEDLIDEIQLALIPIVLGPGIPLFPDSTPETSLHLVSSEAFDTGVVLCTYARAKDVASSL